MLHQPNLYQSILSRLSLVAADQLQQVDAYLQSLTQERTPPVDKRVATMKLAGSWNDMSEDDFAEYLKATKDAGRELFSREVEL